MIRKVLKQLVSWLYPTNIYCISCGDFIEKSKPYSLCDACVRKIHWIRENRCRICGKELEENHVLCYDCRETKRSFDLGISCVQYGRMEKELIRRFKYKDCGYMGQFLAQLMAERLEAEPELRSSIGFVAAVPMYRKKEGVRGYNQAEVLAAEVARTLSLPYYRHFLCRCRNTMPMNKLGVEERRENVKNAFCLSAGWGDVIKNKVALLVDDVYTTGSTADACAEALRAAGAEKVFVLAFASGADRQRKISH